MSGEKKRDVLLEVTSILLMALAAIGLVRLVMSVASLVGQGPQGLSASFEQAGLPSGDAAVGALTAIGVLLSLTILALQLGAGICGLRLLRGRGTARRCETLGIAASGASVVAWLTDRLLLGLAGTADVAWLLCAMLVPLLFYRGARGGVMSDFWEGIKRKPVAPAAQPVDKVVNRFALDHEKETLRPAQKGEDVLVEFLSLDEYEQRSSDSPITRHVARSARSIHHCLASTFGDAVYGTLLIPREALGASGIPLADDVPLAFCLSRDRLTLVGDDEAAEGFVTYYVAHQVLEKRAAAAVLLELLDLVIRDDMAFLSDVEDGLDRLEVNMGKDVSEIPQDLDDFVIRERSQLHALESFYRQITDVADTVAVSPAEVASAPVQELFRELSARCERLAADARDLRDYALQIRNMYQSKIDVRQNKVMSVLTIVTSIIMPLTLLTGWYGMNFENMPELRDPNAYYLLIAIAAIVITVEVIVFKVKRWF